MDNGEGRWRRRSVLNITKSDALAYHSGGRPGKIEITPTKPCRTQRDLSMANPQAWHNRVYRIGGQLQRTAQKSVSVDSETPVLLLQNVI
jgi:hypothetical protein